MKQLFIALLLGGGCMYASPIASPSYPCNLATIGIIGTCSHIEGFGGQNIILGVAAIEDFGNVGTQSVTIDVFGYTSGPVRTGRIDIEGYGFGDVAGLGATAGTFGHIGPYSCFSGNTTNCGFISGDFTLGVPFEISFTSSASSSRPTSGADTFLNLQFQLYELNSSGFYAALPIYLYDAAVPEPAPFALCFSGLAAIFLIRRISSASTKVTGR